MQETPALPWAETAVVAGVGARTATEILEASCAAAGDPPPRRFVLQPTMQFIAYAHSLRKALHKHGYSVVEERWLDENRANAKRAARAEGKLEESRKGHDAQIAMLWESRDRERGLVDKMMGHASPCSLKRMRDSAEAKEIEAEKNKRQRTEQP